MRTARALGLTPAMASSTTPSMAACTRTSRDLAFAVSDITCERPSAELAARRTTPSRSKRANRTVMVGCSMPTWRRRSFCSKGPLSARAKTTGR
jgi:hypothetical protein